MLENKIINFRICRHKNLGKWMVNVRYSGKDYHVGYFSSLVDARIERNRVLNMLFGEGGLTKAWPQKKVKEPLKKLDLLIQEMKDRQKKSGTSSSSNPFNKSLEKKEEENKNQGIIKSSPISVLDFLIPKTKETD